MKLVRTFALVALSLASAACSKNEPEPASQTTSTPTSTAAATSTASASASAATQTATTTPASMSGGTSTPAAPNPALLDPGKANEQAPAQYKAKFVTSKGEFIVEVHKDWAPFGANRFYNLVKIGYFNDQRFFRAVDGFMVQWGIHGDPNVSKRWVDAKFSDDVPKQSNTRGMMTFATSGQDSRTTQVFVNYSDKNARLDAMGFSPFGKVIKGMEVLDGLDKEYGDAPPNGHGPNQGLIQSRGNAYLNEKFPQLDYIKEATIVP